MMKEALAYFPIKVMPLIGLGLFFMMFVLVVLWVYRKSGRQIYDHLGALPLADECVNEHLHAQNSEEISVGRSK